MKIVIHRCRNCGKRYDFIISGCGCNDKNNNDTYCPDCMAIINKALAENTKEEDKVRSKINNIDNLPQEIIDRINKADKDYDISTSNNNLLRLQQPLCLTGIFEDYDSVEKYIIDGCIYYKALNKKTGNTDYFSEYEYTKKTGITDIQYKDFDSNSDRKIPIYCFRLAKAENIIPCPVPEPIGKLFYFDIKY